MGLSLKYRPVIKAKSNNCCEIAEIERRALEEERRTSPRYVRGKEVRRRGYARYRFLKGFKVSLRGVVYELEWVTAVSYTHLTLPTNREV